MANVPLDHHLGADGVESAGYVVELLDGSVRRMNHEASEGTHSRSGSRQVAGAGLALPLRWNLKVIEPLCPNYREGNKVDHDCRRAVVSSHEAVDVYAGCYYRMLLARIQQASLGSELIHPATLSVTMY